jgi:hypothetical protein
MQVTFLLDENLSPRYKKAILRLGHEIDILRVGDAGAPALKTADPDLLHFLEISGRALVTDNRKSMPGHLQAHWAAGGHTWGVFWIRPGTSIGEAAEAIHFIWITSEAEEWIDKTAWIPI